MKNFHVIRHRRKFYIASTLIILAGVITMIVNQARGVGAFALDTEFTGGTSFHFYIGESFNNGDIAQIVRDITGQNSPTVQKTGGGSEVIVKVQSVGEDVREAVLEAVAAKYNHTAAETRLNISDVSGVISGEMQRAAFFAVAVALGAMLIYVSIRFRNVLTGGAAIIAQLHDALVMMAGYAILRIPLNYAFIAAVLTVLGYSINSTIVVFDRSRENRSLDKRLPREELVDTSVKQTLTRSAYTSITTLFTLATLAVFGVQSVREFTIPIIIGVVSGTYASVFLAGSLWYTFSGWTDKIRERRKAR